MPIDTTKVARRQLRFTNYEELLAEAERLATAAQVKSLGNWTLGQTFAHLSGAIVMSLDGAKVKAPLVIRWIAPLFKNRVLRVPMQPGFKLPENVQRQFVPNPDIGTAEAFQQLQLAVRRLKNESQRHPHPAFGRMNGEQWDQLHWRHAELHLSFHEA